MSQKPVKVLQVLGYFDRGGAEAMVMNLFRQADPSQVRFGFVVHGDRVGAFEQEVIDAGADVFRVPDYTGLNHQAYKKAWQAIFESHPDYHVIHGHVRSTANIYLKIARQYGLKTIAHSHNTSSGTGVAATVKNLFQKGINRHTDQFIGCSREAGEWLFGETITRQDNFNVLNNAIDARSFRFDPEKREAKRQELGLSNQLTIGHVGRFHEQKNHDYLIDIFKAVRDVKPDAVLLLIGAGDKKEKIEAKVKKLGLQQQVKFLGLRADVEELLQAMDVFLFPSLFEGLPVTLVETQAAALPAVVSDTITRDIELTDYISYVSLNDPPKTWAAAIIEADRRERKDTLQAIQAAHYDIETSTEWYTQFIRDMH